MKDNIITIDGPSASGKGSLARNIAAHLNFDILDSGLLYRVYAYLYDCGLEHSKIVSHIKKDIFFKTDLNGLTIQDGKEDITGNLRSEKTAKAASKISSLKETRSNLLELQRGFYSTKGLVADGRDMGTVVFPNAKLKIFLIASPEVRAKRRYLELQNRGQEVNMLALIDDIKQRDLKDQTRVLSPLIPAEDSVVIDSSDMSLDEVLSFTKKLTKRKLNK
ncbi:(d)CMP kinase [Gammaproteobacteria bacterium]|nr:(d)CMP kinase [Gammaproteobacteria bacterium]MDC3312970.1 (d)CMP kinase [Gammaproteobacteria bacterium]